MRVTLDYGKTGLDVELPAERVVGMRGIVCGPLGRLGLGGEQRGEDAEPAMAAVRELGERMDATEAKLREIMSSIHEQCVATADEYGDPGNYVMGANLGGYLMASGIPYDSAQGRAICAAISAIMTGISYATSAEMAEKLGAFPGYKKNREHMLRVMRNHRRAAHGEAGGYEKLAVAPVPLDIASLKDKRLAAMMDPKKMPFDGKRMIYGGFKVIVEA